MTDYIEDEAESSEPTRDYLLTQVQSLISVCDACIEDCNRDPLASIDGIKKLVKRVEAEKRYLNSLLEPASHLTVNHCRSSNVYHLNSLVGVIKSKPDVDSVLETFSLFNQRITIDIVYENQLKWMKVVARNPQCIHLTFFDENDTARRSVLTSAHQYIETSKANPHDFQQPTIVFYFSRGVTEGVRERLSQQGLLIEGELVPLTDKTQYRLTHVEDDSSDIDNDNLEDVDDLGNELEEDTLPPATVNYNQVNLDVSTLIALVSELTHGGHVYKYEDSAIDIPARLEREMRLFPALIGYLEGKQWIVCRTALTEFQEIVETVGGPMENQRAAKLMDKITIVDDNPSERAMTLKESAKVRLRTKIIFGTGDKLRIITVTSNTSFVRSATQQGVRFAVNIHHSYPMKVDRFVQAIRYEHLLREQGSARKITTPGAENEIRREL